VLTAASSSQKGSHQETREMVTYDDDEIFWLRLCACNWTAGAEMLENYGLDAVWLLWPLLTDPTDKCPQHSGCIACMQQRMLCH